MPSFEHTKQGRVTVEDEVYKPGDNKQTDLETATTSATDSDQNNPALSRPGISWGELAKDKSKENEVPEIQEKPEPAPAAEAAPVAEARDTATVEEAESANERPKPTPFNDKDLPDPGPAFLQRSAAQLARQEEDNLRKRRGVRGRNRVVSAAAKKTEPSFGEISSPAEVKESLSGRMAHGQPKTERRERREDAPTPKAEAEKQDTQATENIPAEPRE